MLFMRQHAPSLLRRQPRHPPRRPQQRACSSPRELPPKAPPRAEERPIWTDNLGTAAPLLAVPAVLAFAPGLDETRRGVLLGLSYPGLGADSTEQLLWQFGAGGLGLLGGMGAVSAYMRRHAEALGPVFGAFRAPWGVLGAMLSGRLCFEFAPLLLTASTRLAKATAFGLDGLSVDTGSADAQAPRAWEAEAELAGFGQMTAGYLDWVDSDLFQRRDGSGSGGGGGGGDRSAPNHPASEHGAAAATANAATAAAAGQAAAPAPTATATAKKSGEGEAAAYGVAAGARKKKTEGKRAQASRAEVRQATREALSKVEAAGHDAAAFAAAATGQQGATAKRRRRAAVEAAVEQPSPPVIARARAEAARSSGTGGVAVSQEVARALYRKLLEVRERERLLLEGSVRAAPGGGSGRSRGGIGGGGGGGGAAAGMGAARVERDRALYEAQKASCKAQATALGIRSLDRFAESELALSAGALNELRARQHELATELYFELATGRALRAAGRAAPRRGRSRRGSARADSAQGQDQQQQQQQQQQQAREDEEQDRAERLAARSAAGALQRSLLRLDAEKSALKEAVARDYGSTGKSTLKRSGAAYPRWKDTAGMGRLH